MATPFTDVYSVFLSQVNDDSFVPVDEAAEAIIEADLAELLYLAIDNFKFPRVSLDNSDSSFSATLNREEINILSRYMKAEWANRLATDFRLVSPQYQSRDFKQAASPDSLKKALDAFAKNCFTEAERAANLYHRTQNHQPYDYSTLAGSNNV